MKNLKNSQVRALGAVTVIVILVASAGLAAAQGPRRGHSKGGCDMAGPGQRIEMMAKHLDLSDDQLTAIKAIHENSRKDGLEKQKELKRLRNELQGEMLKDNPSEKAVLGINSKMGALKTEMKALKLKTRLAVREELNAEQRDKMLVKGGHGGRGGRGGHDKNSCDSRRCGPSGKDKGPRNSPECKIK